MSLIDLDSMLDATLANVEAKPDYVTPPTGVAMVSIAKVALEQAERFVKDSQGNKTEQKEPFVRIRMTRSIAEYLEYADDKAVPVAPNSMYSDTFTYDEDGLGYLKRDAAMILACDVEELNDTPLRELFSVLEDCEPKQCIINTSTRKHGDNEYTNTTTRVVAEQ